MNKNVQESYYNNFSLNNISWKVSNQSNSLKNIKNFQKDNKAYKSFQGIDERFMNDSKSSLFIINNNIIFSNNREKMLQDFKSIIPNINAQELISIYANQKFIYQSYLHLIAEHPEINEYQIKNSRNIYKIDVLEDGVIKLVATNLSDLETKNRNCIKKYNSFGVRATVIIYPNNPPIVKYSHFTK